MLDFAAEHGIRPEVQVIPVQKVNKAFDEMVANNIRDRYVIDSKSLEADREGTDELPTS